MRNKTSIIVLTVIISLLCIYYVSFTFVARGVESDAREFATEADGTVSFSKKQKYLDSIYLEPVYNLGFAEYTYKEVKDSELKLGLDLQGGMHVTLEVSPIEILRAMSNNSGDSAFNSAISMASQRQTNSDQPFTRLFYSSYQEIAPDGRLSAIFSNTANKGRISFESTNKEVMEVINEEVDDAIDRSFNILRTRIDKFGVTQPNIQKLEGTGRIQVELPGVDNPERVRKLLQGVAKLEFYEVFDNQELIPYITQANEKLVEIEEAKKALNPKDGSRNSKVGDNPFANETLNENIDLEDENLTVEPDVATNERQDPFGAEETLDRDAEDAAMDTSLGSLLSSDTSDLASTDSLNEKASILFTALRAQSDLIYETRDTAAIIAALNNPKVKPLFPANMRFMWSVKPFEGDNGIYYLQLFAVRTGRGGKAPLNGDVVTDARQDIDPTGKGYEVSMQMNAVGAKQWRKMTSDNIGRRIAIVLDNYVYSAPNVNGEIPNGNSSISGSFTLEESKDLANILKAGKLPAPTRIVEEAIVGPSLGQEAISQGLTSILAGLAAVVIFMVAYYALGGLVANIALLVNIFFIVGILAQLNAALTLPGIAGIVLTIGMSIDANVLIFERIREELRLGKSKMQAIQLGYEKAFSSIIDSNVTTFLIGVILYSFGSGPVKGFAVTLMIGIVCSFFSAVFITRVIVEYISRKNEGANMSFSLPFSKNLLTNTKIDVIGNRKTAYIISGVVIALGLGALVIQGGMNLGVDFKGGRSYVVRFDEPVVASDLRNALADDFQGKGTEVKTFGANNQVKITTSYLIDNEEQEADTEVQNVLMTGLSDYKSLNPKIMSSAKVGASIADDIKNTSQTAVLIALVVIFLYILIRFRRWQYGMGAVVALFHDVLIVIGLFSIMWMFGVSYEVDQVFIAAMLTVIGYSINDTVVVFDRLRENIAENSRKDIKTVLNGALNDTFSRTVMTSLTTLLVVLILFIFGGEVLRGFSFALLVGIVTGTYSSVFIAAPVVYDTSLKAAHRDEEAVAKVRPSKVK